MEKDNEVTISCSKETLALIKKSLDLYSRVGLGQFWYLDDCETLFKNVSEKSNLAEFRRKAIELSNFYTGYTGNASYGIFNKEKVGTDVLFATELNRIITNFLMGNNKEVDICKIAKIEPPKIKIK